MGVLWGQGPIAGVPLTPVWRTTYDVDTMAPTSERLQAAIAGAGHDAR